MVPLFVRFTGTAIVFFARAITAVRALWQGIEPGPGQRVYFANHTSHGDFILVWAVLPPRLRHATRPVAGADYWLASAVRRFLGRDVFKAVLITRKPSRDTENPITQMSEALDAGSSLIVFPEGTRNTTEEPLLPFKGGLYHLAKARPQIDLVPVWIENLNRALPKGEIIPIPPTYTVTFGAPLHLRTDEDKAAFLLRAEAALIAIAPQRVEGGS